MLRYDHAERVKREKTLLEKLNTIQSLLRKREINGKPNGTEENPGVLLDRVLDEMHVISAGSVQNSCGLNMDDCVIEGQWVSDAAGGVFAIPAASGATADLTLCRKKAHDHVHNGFMNFKDWNTTLTFPYANSSQYLIINAWNNRDKLIATFMGECRRCRQKEILAGNWLIVSHSRDCESEGSTAKLISDVFRRDNMECLRRRHLPGLQKKRTRANTSANGGTKDVVATPARTSKSKTSKTSPLPIKLH